jgi:MFS family permease
MIVRFFNSRRGASSSAPDEASNLPQESGLDATIEGGETSIETSSETGSERLPVETVRLSMGRVVMAWGFGAAFFNLTMGAIYTSFVLRLGGDERVLGFLFAALPLMSFLQVISARMIEKTGQRKRQMMIAGLVGRSLWMIMPLFPMFVHWFPRVIQREHVLPMVIGCVLLSSVCQAFTGPAFFAWMSDLVPARVRPRFFAERMRVGTTAAIFTALASGYIADRYTSNEVLYGLLVFAGFCGLMDVALFIGVKEPPVDGMPKNEKLPSVRASLGEALSDSNVRRFLAFVSLLCIGYGLTGAISWLFALEYLNYPKTTAALVLNIGPLLGVALTSSFWGAMIKRYGNRPVIRLCSVGIAIVPLGFITAQNNTWFWLWVVTFFSGIVAAGIELTNVNQITSLAPHIPRSTMTAIFSITAGLSMAAASLLSGQLAHMLRWVDDMEFQPFGLEIVNYHLLFGLALLLRLFNAVFVAPRLQEPTATPTLEAVKEMVPEIIQALAERLSRPVHWRAGD